MLLTGIGPGDEVIVPAFTLSSTANAALLRGATVRFADIRASDANIDPESVAARMTSRTRAVICVHYGGVAADVDRLSELCGEIGADLVEDAAHGLAASSNGVALGRFGRIGALSFHRTKNISTVEGGALIINDPELIEAGHIAVDKGTDRHLFEEGARTSYEWAGQGSAWRMADPMVDLLGEQLSRLDDIQRRRHAVWTAYANQLAEWASRNEVTLPVIPQNAQHPAHLFWIAVPNAARRDDVVAHCAAQGVEVARHYGSLPLSAFGRSITRLGDECPVAQDVSERLLRLPLHHELSDDAVARVIDALLTAPL